MPQSRATAPLDPRTRTRGRQIAIAVLALLLIALAGFYTLVTGRITDGSARLKDGAGLASAGADQLKDGTGKLSTGATLADTGAGKLSDGARKIHAGITGKLAPGAEQLRDGAEKLAAGAVKIEADVANKLAPGVYQVDDGAGQLAAGTAQLKGYRGANGNPEAGTGTAALAQALELLQAAADDPVQGLVPLSAVKDKIAKITAGAHKLDAGAARRHTAPRGHRRTAGRGR